MDAFLVVIKLATLTCFVNIADDGATYERIMSRANYNTPILTLENGKITAFAVGYATLSTTSRLQPAFANQGLKLGRKLGLFMITGRSTGQESVLVNPPVLELSLNGQMGVL